MSTCTIVLYKATDILPEKNFKVDSISTYLNSLATTRKIVLTKEMYCKHGLNISRKVDLSQVYLSPAAYYDFNYCSITNDMEQTYYYFITSKEWLGQSTLRLNLYCDTINTFADKVTLSDKTKILRQHFDRWTKRSTTTYSLTATTFDDTDSNTIYLIQNLDRYIEDEDQGWIIRLHGKVGYYANDNIVWYGEGTFQYWDIELHSDGTILIYVDNQFYLSMDASQVRDICFIGQVSSYNANLPNYIDYQIDESTTNKYTRKIPLLSEGVNPILYKSQTTTLKQVGSDYDWFLIYANENDPTDSLVNPVKCLLCADTALKIKGVLDYYSITPSDISTSLYYYILGGSDIVVYYGNDLNNLKSISLKKYGGGDWWNNVCISSDGTDFTLRVGSTYKGASTLVFSTAYAVPSYTCKYIQVINGSVMYSLSTYSRTTTIAAIRAGSTTDISTGSTATINSIDTLDRTDAKLIKIIKLPYCPEELYASDDADAVINSGAWSYNATYGMLELIDLNTKFNYNFSSSDVNPLSELEPKEFVVDTSILKFIYFESKLYHSDYYLPKMVYDSFSFTFRLEEVDMDEFLDTHITGYGSYNFVVTTTINSRFMMVFPDYILESSLEDYDNILAVARNNELPLYNVAYINYIRAGYNYEVKAKERQTAVGWLGVGLSAVGAVASFASSVATGGAGIAAGVSLLTSSVAQIASVVNSTASAEANIAYKKEQLKNQATSVSGSDDVDLMSVYAENRFKLMVYEASENMRNALFDLFFYTGYLYNQLGIPDTTSRCRFNFIQIQPVYESIPNINDEFIEDLTLRFNTGVTYIHYYDSTWDFEQVYENWETSLL